MGRGVNIDPNFVAQQQQLAQMQALKQAKSASAVSGKKVLWIVVPVFVLAIAVVLMFSGAFDKPDTVRYHGELYKITDYVVYELPEGYEAHVVPRSSTYKNFGIIQTNHMGVIDHSYCGDNDQWYFPALATRDVVLHVNDRICQFRIMKNQPKLIFEETDTLTGEDRGGFGSTGIR